MSLATINQYIDLTEENDEFVFIWVKVKSAQDYCMFNGIIRSKYPNWTADCQGCENIFQVLDRYLKSTNGKVDPMIYTFWDDGKKETLQLAHSVTDGEMHPLGEMVIKLSNPRIVIYFSTNSPIFEDINFEYRFVDLSGITITNLLN